jgi:ATP-dependent protease ClpP protease subunit
MKKKEEEIEKYCKVNKINKTKEIHIYLNNMIAEPYLYVDFLEQLREVNNNDSVFIHINSNGGYIDTGIQLITE